MTDNSYSSSSESPSNQFQLQPQLLSSSPASVSLSELADLLQLANSSDSDNSFNSASQQQQQQPAPFLDCATGFPSSSSSSSARRSSRPRKRKQLDEQRTEEEINVKVSQRLPGSAYTAVTQSQTGSEPKSTRHSPIDGLLAAVAAEIFNIGSDSTNSPSARPFRCPACRAAFTQRGSLKKHSLIHLQLRPHVCDFPGCSSSFTQKNNLVRHQSGHLNLRPHKCRFDKMFGCNKSFARKENLLLHHKIHEKRILEAQQISNE